MPFALMALFSSNRRRYIMVSQRDGDGNAFWRALYCYPSHGRRYWRLQWGHGSSIDGYLHIPGGAVGNPIVSQRLDELRGEMAKGRSLADLQLIIQSWRPGNAAH